MNFPADDAWSKRRVAVSTAIEISALELFVANGVDNVTVEEIADAAKISRRTFYRYFDTVDDLLAALPRRALHRISAAVLARPASETLRQAVSVASRETSSGMPADERYIESLCAQIFTREPDRWWRAISRMSPTSLELYEDMVRNRLEKCGEDLVGAEFIAAALHGLVDQVTRMVWSSGRNANNADMFDDALDLVLKRLER